MSIHLNSSIYVFKETEMRFLLKGFLTPRICSGLNSMNECVYVLFFSILLCLLSRNILFQKKTIN